MELFPSRLVFPTQCSRLFSNFLTVELHVALQFIPSYMHAAWVPPFCLHGDETKSILGFRWAEGLLSRTFELLYTHFWGHFFVWKRTNCCRLYHKPLSLHGKPGMCKFTFHKKSICNKHNCICTIQENNNQIITNKSKQINNESKSHAHDCILLWRISSNSQKMQNIESKNHNKPYRRKSRTFGGNVFNKYRTFHLEKANHSNGIDNSYRLNICMLHYCKAMFTPCWAKRIPRKSQCKCTNAHFLGVLVGKINNCGLCPTERKVINLGSILLS